MNRSKVLLCVPILFLSAIFASSCSGPKNGVCTVNCGGGGGNGNVIVTVTSTPSTTFSFPFLEWEITSVQLIDSTGGATILLEGALPPTDFARLQTDSQLLGTAQSIPAKAYTKVQIGLKPSTTTGYFYNSSGSTLFNCVAGAVCPIPNTVPGFQATTVTVPASFTVNANGNSGFSLNFDLSKAVTSAGGMTFDFTQSGAITLATLPRTPQTTGLDLFENFTGTISAVNTVSGTTTISMSSLASDTRTFTLATMPQFDDPFSVCGGTANVNSKCLAVNQNISVDAVINDDGTLTATEVDFLDPAPFVSETEGIIVKLVSASQFQMVVTNATSITGFLTGTLVTVNVNGASTYFVDPKNLGSAVSTTPLGFQSSADLVLGQSVMLLGGTEDFTNNTLTGYTRTLLRYSSIGGTIQSPSGTIFALSGVDPLLTSLATHSVQVQTFANTSYDNVAGFSGLASNTNVSVRGLFLNPTAGEAEPLLAAKVRKHN